MKNLARRWPIPFVCGETETNWKERNLNLTLVLFLHADKYLARESISQML